MLIDGEEVENVESDSIVFVPDNSKLTIRNGGKSRSGVMKVQLTIYQES